MNRYDFLYFFDVTDGNPNGDPDAGNLPRVDPESGHGLVTDVCLKRKIRNFVQVAKGDCLATNEDAGYAIFIREGAALNKFIMQAHEETGGVPKKGADKSKVKDAREWMCKNFFDVRTFGAVLSTGANAGQVRGPVQFGFARSFDPIISLEHAITRVATTNDKVKVDSKTTMQTYEEWEEKQPENQLRTMGRKFTVPYGLYCVQGFINPFLAEKTGFGEDDLGLLKDALNHMFDFDRSAARGQMKPCRCIVFKHDSKLGNARADQLFSRVNCDLTDEVKSSDQPPRSFDDYVITLDDSNLPEGVAVEEWVEAAQPQLV